jgi:outer membrane immunogenic protein
MHGIVVGIEGDISWSDIDATATFDTDKNGPAVWSKKHDISLDYFGTVRARLGVVTGSLLPYVTGGLAWGKTNADLAVAYIPPPPQLGGTSYASGDATHVGWTIGGGVEWKVASNWSIKAEYLHIDLGKEQYAFVGKVFNGAPFDTDSFPADLTVDTVRVGLNYKFGSRDEPVPLK